MNKLLVSKLRICETCLRAQRDNIFVLLELSPKEEYKYCPNCLCIRKFIEHPDYALYRTENEPLTK